jgi:hypothetical protein
LNFKLKIRPNRLESIKVSVLLFLAVSFVISSFPLLSGFEPASSYIEIPQYWYQATSWINSQPGDWKVLLTPLNDYYQLPYLWGQNGTLGYYGSDQLLERLFEKPIVSTAALNGYVTNDDTFKDLMQIRTAAKSNNADEFKALLDLLSIKYIIQRNDVVTDIYDANHVLVSLVTERNLKTPIEMRPFFTEQPYLKLVRTFGQLDIYEYTQAKPSINALSPLTLDQADIHIDERVSLNKTWDFSVQNFFEGWNWTVSSKSQATCQISQNGGSLKADMWTSPNSSIRLDSPLIQVESQSKYLIKAGISAVNVDHIEVKVAEYSQDRTLLENWSFAQIGGRNFMSPDLVSEFEPRTENTKYLNIQIWSEFGNETIQSTLKVNSLSVVGTISTLNKTGLENLYASSPNNPTISQIQNLSPTKMVVVVNATKPFILQNSQELDKFWVAEVGGQKVSPTPVFLGLKGFMINETGLLTITIVYEPQNLFNYSLIIFGVTVLLLGIGLVYVNRKTVKNTIKKVRNKS